MSQKPKRVSAPNNTLPYTYTESPSGSKGGKRKRLLPQIPTTSTPVARGNETTINLTTVSEISAVSVLTQNTTADVTRSPAREFVSPVKFTDDGEDSCVTVAVRVRPFSER